MLDEHTWQSGPVAIHYAEGPSTGPPLVLLHGAGHDWKAGELLLEALLAQWHVYAPDQRGHGASSWTPDEYSVQIYATDAATFLQTVVGTKTVLCGHSLGGVVALLVAASRPELVRALILVDVPFTLDALRARLTTMPAEMPPELRVDPTLHRVLREHFDAHYADYVPETLAPQVTCPVLVLQADPAAGGELTDADVAHIPPRFRQAMHHRFAGSGHTIWRHQPEEMLQVMASFLSQLPDADPIVRDSP
jgi:pimeloyl-ACP methyl ester carboxylesterase